MNGEKSLQMPDEDINVQDDLLKARIIIKKYWYKYAVKGANDHLKIFMSMCVERIKNR